MNVGLFFGDTRGIEDQVTTARRAEDDGFASCWFNSTGALDAMTAIAVCGRATTRIEFGTAVVPVYTRHPQAMAQQAASTQAATGNRFSLGIGASHKPVVEERWGLSFNEPLQYMTEYVTVLQELLQKGATMFEGDVFRVHAELAFSGMSPCPVLLAALGPRMLELAGSSAGGTVTWVVGPKTLADHIIPRLTEAASRAGRPAPRVVVALPVAVTDDPPAARQAAARTFSRYGELPSYRAMLDQEGVAGPADVMVAGDEDGVGEQLQRFKEIGVTDFVASLFPVGEDRRGSYGRAWRAMTGLAKRLAAQQL